MSIRTADPLAAPAPHLGTVGVLQGSSLYIASVLGTGILVLPSLAATAAGPASILAVLVVLVISIPLAGTFAALAARHPDAGGVATFVRLALGPTAARMAGYWFYFGVSVGAPVVAVLGASYIGAIVGAPQWVVVVIAIVIFVPPLVSNLFGLRVSGAVQLALTGLLVAIVVGVVVVSAPAAHPANFTPFLPHGWAGVGAAISLFVWAFAGWEAVTHIAGEFKNPRRTIPLATAIAIATVGIAYLALQVVTIAVLGSDAGTGPVPLLDLVATTAPGVGPVAVAVIAGVVSVGVLNTYLGAFAKLGASLGRDGDLPRWMAAGAHTGGIPRRSLLVIAVLAAGYLVALILTGLDLAAFVLIHTSCMVAIYAVGMTAALRLLERWSVGWWMAVIACILVVGLLLLAGAHLLVPASLALAAVVLTVVKRMRARSSRPVHLR
ncbi:amino acid efflux transporter [Cryobacterium mesophilum]|uniref:Amino acid permease n=1 Tax=Terrimesophilobacter mesophilus TaxID=433647 RepID=A0A4R8VEA5_9MICO|nr:amino acid permease [Terrimesophilobacter mesophilus]MBB5633463.1 amino acid efflux transporter [Terrimesophilobacter mesophilus]TFB80177.1 amino acid permease [Terrimesophilobacter mesophilus]